jgi:predicted kinase
VGEPEQPRGPDGKCTTFGLGALVLVGCQSAPSSPPAGPPGPPAGALPPPTSSAATPPPTATPPPRALPRSAPPSSPAPLAALALLVSGPPASGKTTLARAVAGHIGACLLDLDVVAGALTETIVRLLGGGDLDAPQLAGEVRAARYECLLATAEDNLRVGTSVVLVAPFSAERTDAARWASLRRRLTDAGGEPRLVWLRLPPDELVRRLRARAAERDTAKIADQAGFLAQHPVTPPAFEHIAVDATGDIARQLAGVLHAIS